MSTTETLSPEQQQDDFALSFLSWLKNNFEEIANDVYRDAMDPAPIQKDTVLWTAAECLAHYRNQCIPPLPLVRHTQAEHDALNLFAEEMRKTNIFFAGLQKIQVLLMTSTHVQKHEIIDILIDTVNQITSPA